MTNKKFKDYVKEVLVEILEEQQSAPVRIKVKKDKLSDILGLKQNEHLGSLSVDTIVTKMSRAIKSGKVTYQEGIRMLNAVAVLNKTNDPEFTKKIRSVMHQLKEKFREE